MSFLTCFCDLPQKEHLSRSPPSPIRATYGLPCPHRPDAVSEPTFVVPRAGDRLGGGAASHRLDVTRCGGFIRPLGGGVFRAARVSPTGALAASSRPTAGSAPLGLLSG